MIIKLKDKEKWNKIFVLLPVKTIENELVWYQYVYVRHRFIGHSYEGYGDEFIIEYSLEETL